MYGAALPWLLHACMLCAAPVTGTFILQTATARPSQCLPGAMPAAACIKTAGANGRSVQNAIGRRGCCLHAQRFGQVDGLLRVDVAHVHRVPASLMEQNRPAALALVRDGERPAQVVVNEDGLAAAHEVKRLCPGILAYCGSMRALASHMTGDRPFPLHSTTQAWSNTQAPCLQMGRDAW